MLYLKYKLQHNHIPCFCFPSPLSMHASTKDLPSWKVQLKSQRIHSLSKFQGRSPSKALFTWGPFIYRTFCSLKLLKSVAAMPITTCFSSRKAQTNDLYSTSCVGSMSIQKVNNQNLLIFTATSDARASVASFHPDSVSPFTAPF